MLYLDKLLTVDICAANLGGGEIVHINSHGAYVQPDGQVQFRLWAPAFDRVHLVIEEEASSCAMTPLAEGWHVLVTSRAAAGTHYRFLLPNGQHVPDPASRYQPEDVHGPSEVVDLESWKWSDTGWLGRPWSDAVIYELHVGTFTPAGTFQAAIEKLDHLRALGITAIEIMPVSDFRGARNWGYDGVLPYAPDSSYGRPEDFKALIEAAHQRGLMVFLDVVYNHFGPDGNYLSSYAPAFFTDRHKTPWGRAVNFESRPVRDFVIQNALYWLRDFHLDGLRLDAVHAILDDSPTHILQEMSQCIRDEFPERHIHLILENEENQASWLQPALFTAQWNDDVHHVLHTALTGEDAGYYSEYIGDTRKLGRALAEGFAFQGEMMSYRGKARGEVSTHLPPGVFIAFLQNHDQIGNRAFGDRIHASVPPKRLRAAAAVYLLLPQTPMLFMGEEWGASSPFPFFSDFGPELGEAVRNGRREEFARFPEFQDAALRERIPDPQSDQTFASAKLRWDELRNPSHAEWLEWYRRILACRRASIAPLRESIRHAATYELLGEGAVAVRWVMDGRRRLVLTANLSDTIVEGPSRPSALIWREGNFDSDISVLHPWSVAWWIDD